jgi:hypothetical protein
MGAIGNYEIHTEQVMVPTTGLPVSVAAPAGKRVLFGWLSPAPVELVPGSSHPNSDGTAWECAFQSFDPVLDPVEINVVCADVEYQPVQPGCSVNITVSPTC